MDSAKKIKLLYIVHTSALAFFSVAGGGLYIAFHWFLPQPLIQGPSAEVVEKVVKTMVDVDHLKESFIFSLRSQQASAHDWNSVLGGAVDIVILSAVIGAAASLITIIYLRKIAPVNLPAKDDQAHEQL